MRETWHMTGTDLALIFILLVLLAAAIVLGAAEASLLRVQRVRVEVQAAAGDRRSVKLLGLLDDLPRVLNTVLLAVLLVQIDQRAPTRPNPAARARPVRRSRQTGVQWSAGLARQWSPPVRQAHGLAHQG